MGHGVVKTLMPSSQSLDGGGTKGLVALEMLKRIEDRAGKPVHQLFDLICGTR